MKVRCKSPELRRKTHKVRRKLRCKVKFNRLKSD